MVQVDPSTFKQILFNLLSNALKHGERDILLRVRARQRGISFLLGNRTAEGDRKLKQGLGIGLRLVRALASQMRQTRLTTRHQRFFWVRLQLPTGGPPEPIES